MDTNTLIATMCLGFFALCGWMFYIAIKSEKP
jgi:hypothetical protein